MNLPCFLKNHIYKEEIDLLWTKERFTLQGKKGTRIVLEERDNHIKGMKCVTPQGEFPLDQHNYLVFYINQTFDPSVLQDIPHREGIVLQKSENGIEVACHHPQVFFNGVLRKFEQQGVLRVTWKTIFKKQGEFPVYVNAKGWQLFYNLYSVLRTECCRLWSYLISKIKKA